MSNSLWNSHTKSFSEYLILQLPFAEKIKLLDLMSLGENWKLYKGLKIAREFSGEGLWMLTDGIFPFSKPKFSLWLLQVTILKVLSCSIVSLRSTIGKRNGKIQKINVNRHKLQPWGILPQNRFFFITWAQNTISLACQVLSLLSSGSLHISGDFAKAFLCQLHRQDRNLQMGFWIACMKANHFSALYDSETMKRKKTPYWHSFLRLMCECWLTQPLSEQPSSQNGACLFA